MNTLENELKHFSGSETFYRHTLMRKFVYTEGVQYLAEKGGAYWLIDYILSYQLEPPIKDTPFQVWKIKVADDLTGTITVEDGNKHLIKCFNLSFTDFPIKEYTLWFTDNTLLLPSEY